MGTSYYTVRVANTFEAESPEDAVIQMAEWLAENARLAGYRARPLARTALHVRVESKATGDSVFLDAERVYGS